MIDVVRALAISLFFVFYDTVTRTRNSPSGFQFSAGWFRVELFSIVSGYCIAETIGRCRTVALILMLRINRLYPAFAIIVILLAAIKNAALYLDLLQMEIPPSRNCRPHLHLPSYRSRSTPA